MDKVYSPSLVQVYLEASSKQEVIMLQYKNNLQNNKMFDYSTPMKDGKKWIVWYYADILNDKPLTIDLEVPNGGKPQD